MLTLFIFLGRLVGVCLALGGAIFAVWGLSLTPTIDVNGFPSEDPWAKAVVLGMGIIASILGLLSLFAKPFRPDAEPPISRGLSMRRYSLWPVLAIITAVIHGIIYWGPIPIESLRSGATGDEQYFVLLGPTVWSIFIYLCFRRRSERVVAWCSFVATFLWFASVGGVRT